MKLKSFEITDFKGVEHVLHRINANPEFCSGKTPVCEALKVVKGLVTGDLDALPITHDATIKITLENGNTEATYEVQLNQYEILLEKFFVNGELRFVAGESCLADVPYLFCRDAKDILSSICQEYTEFIKFFDKFDVIMMDEISRIRFRFGKYKLCGHSPLNQTEIDYINSICKSVSPDLYLRKVIDNGQKDNYCEFMFKSGLVEDYSSSVRVILAALMFFVVGDVLVLDDVPYTVINVIKENMPKNKQLIYTCYSHDIGCEQF